jgi:hypothetical protein
VAWPERDADCIGNGSRSTQDSFAGIGSKQQVLVRHRSVLTTLPTTTPKREQGDGDAVTNL